MEMVQDEKKRHKGVFLLPNALTTGAMFAGFYSIISGINGHYVAASVAVVVAGLLDGLDGRVARLTNTQSEFGVQYDSLSDLISFGLAPALLAFNWSLSGLRELGPTAGKLGWLAAFLFVACAALRLARFNTQAASADKSYFQGLASPAAAGTLVATIWFFVDHGISGESVRWLIWFETVVLGLLMFSRIRYFSGKSWPKGDRIPTVHRHFLEFALCSEEPDPLAVGREEGLKPSLRSRKLAHRRAAYRAHQKSDQCGRRQFGIPTNVDHVLPVRRDGQR